IGVSSDKFHSRLTCRKRRRAHVDPQHVAEPQILADALMHHLLQHTASTRVAFIGPDAQVFIPKFAPHAENLDPLSRITLDKEVIFHKHSKLQDWLLHLGRLLPDEELSPDVTLILRTPMQRRQPPLR